eukprot:TRINITY_DN459_c0_g1_i1.p1 TRINITY_DN459_c0_g1~~TRINITY_DN459_c0_g1_i1.p1  ORF type:complete len:152 (-),score=13.98 TRINITY_DN459_c0_g1_i1:130-585(-)
MFLFFFFFFQAEDGIRDLVRSRGLGDVYKRQDLECIQDIANRLCAERGWGRPEYIDHGASAVVYKTQQNNEHLAVKIYDPTYFLGENALIEKRRIALQCELNNHGCPYIINILDAAEFSECKTWFLLMEYCPWKSIAVSYTHLTLPTIYSV